MLGRWTGDYCLDLSKQSISRNPTQFLCPKIKFLAVFIACHSVQTNELSLIWSYEKLDVTLVWMTGWIGLTMNGVDVEVSRPRDISSILTFHYLRVICDVLNQHIRALGRESKRITISARITSISPLTPIKSQSVAVNTENSIWDSSVLLRYINWINKTMESVEQINIWLWNNLQDVRTNVTAQCYYHRVLNIWCVLFVVCVAKIYFYVICFNGIGHVLI